MYINEKGKIAHLLEQTAESKVKYVLDGQKTVHEVPSHEFFGEFREATEKEAEKAEGRPEDISGYEA